jgi:hypothetical protein
MNKIGDAATLKNARSENMQEYADTVVAFLETGAAENLDFVKQLGKFKSRFRISPATFAQREGKKTHRENIRKAVNEQMQTISVDSLTPILEKIINKKLQNPSSFCTNTNLQSRFEQWQRKLISSANLDTIATKIMDKLLDDKLLDDKLSKDPVRGGEKTTEEAARKANEQTPIAQSTTDHNGVVRNPAFLKALFNNPNFASALKAAVKAAVSEEVKNTNTKSDDAIALAAIETYLMTNGTFNSKIDQALYNLLCNPTITSKVNDTYVKRFEDKLTENIDTNEAKSLRKEIIDKFKDNTAVVAALKPPASQGGSKKKSSKSLRITLKKRK